MEQINELVSKDAVNQLKEVHAELKAISNLSDEGIRLKCLELAVKADVSVHGVPEYYVLSAAEQYYEFVKGNKKPFEQIPTERKHWHGK